MSQYRLPLEPRISYRPQDFIIHSGVKEVVESIKSAITEDKFRIFYIEGEARSGKTHLSSYLFELGIELGILPHLFSGDRFLFELSELSLESRNKKGFYILDDAHLALNMSPPGTSGGWVSWIEAQRNVGGTIILLSSANLDSFNIDDHILSRIRPGVGFRLAPPTAEEIPELLSAIAKQRGVRIPDRWAQFMVTRMPRSLDRMEYLVERALRLSTILDRRLKLSLFKDVINEG